MKIELLNLLKSQIREVLGKVSEEEKRNNQALADQSSKLEKLISTQKGDQRRKENNNGTN